MTMNALSILTVVCLDLRNEMLAVLRDLRYIWVQICDLPSSGKVEFH